MVTCSPLLTMLLDGRFDHRLTTLQINAGKVCNPCDLEAGPKRELRQLFGIEFHHLFTLANMPLRRIG